MSCQHYTHGICIICVKTKIEAIDDKRRRLKRDRDELLRSIGERPDTDLEA